MCSQFKQFFQVFQKGRYGGQSGTGMLRFRTEMLEMPMPMPSSGREPIYQSAHAAVGTIQVGK
jgi:hypothetical protein